MKKNIVLKMKEGSWQRLTLVEGQNYHSVNYIYIAIVVYPINVLLIYFI